MSQVVADLSHIMFKVSSLCKFSYLELEGDEGVDVGRGPLEGPLPRAEVEVSVVVLVERPRSRQSRGPDEERGGGGDQAVDVH